MLKSYGVVVVVGGPYDFSVSPSPFGLDFGTSDFGTLDSGLTIKNVSWRELSTRITFRSSVEVGLDIVV